MITTTSTPQHRRRTVLLSPSAAEVPEAFGNLTTDFGLHQTLLSDVQRFRGAMYVQDGAISSFQLDGTGRFIHPVDPMSWHLLSTDESGEILSCARFSPCRAGAAFQELGVSNAALAGDSRWGSRLRDSVEATINGAVREGHLVAEVGGWAIRESLRCTSEALRVVLSMYALGSAFGRTIAFSTATTRHCSSAILRRLGARPLQWNDEPLPKYYDPAYGCDMEILAFDSTSANQRHAARAAECLRSLLTVPIVCSTLDAERAGRSLCNLAAQHAEPRPAGIYARA